MEASERELRDLARAVDDRHRDGMPTAVSDIAELHAATRPYRAEATSRRALLRGAGARAGVLTIAGVVVPIGIVASSRGASAQTDTTVPDALSIAAFAESLELAAVQLYQAAGASGKLSAPVAQVGATFGGHHADHAKAFGAAAGAKATGKPNQRLLPTLLDQLANARDEKAVLRIAYDLEDAAASTYLYALGVLQDRGGLALAASILPVEAQHAVVIGTALGKEVAAVVPGFENQDKAVDIAKFPVTTTTSTTSTTAP